jgi:two-component system, NarL family, response regulator NreC
MKRIRILCIDDHAFLVDGLKARFDLEPDIEMVGRLPSADDAVVEARRLRPHIILMDIEMPGVDPFEAVEDLKAQLPETRVIMLSAYVRDHYVSAAFKAGVWGYFSKSDDPDSIIAGIRKVDRGEMAMGPEVEERTKAAHKQSADDAAAPRAKLETLSKREQEVLRMIGRGMSRTQIADAICRSPKTVDGHRERIMAKLDLHTTTDLVRFAIREGLAEV